MNFSNSKVCRLLLVLLIASITEFASAQNAFQQDSGSNGIVSIEAENFDGNVSQGGHDWTLITSPSGYSGTGAMQSTPDNGTKNSTNYETNSPRMDYQINFVKTGSHYIWARGGAPNGRGTSDSFHAGIGSERATVGLNSASAWSWENDGGVTINVTSTGVQTLSIWMREDGTMIDKIVLTTNASYTPSGTGPPESPRSSGNDPVISPNLPSLDFTATEGGSNPAAQSVVITNTGGGTLSWTASQVLNASWLSLSASGAASGDSVTTSVDIQGLTAGSYNDTIRVSDTNASNNPVDVPVTLTVNSSSSPPSITQHPTSQSVTEGQSATFSVTATGSGTLAYEWQKDGAQIIGAPDNSSYTIPSVAMADSGAYRCIVSNGVGQDTSNVATLTVNASGPRVTSGLVVYYKFDEGSGTAVNDQSNGTPMNLNLTGSYTWVSGGNGITLSNGRAGSSGAANKVINALQSTSTSSFEMWFTAANTTQSGPARMMSLEGSSTNFMLGQSNGTDVQVRLLHTGKSEGTHPRLTSTNKFTTNLTHLVHTYDGGVERLYLDGFLQANSVVLSGTYSNWNTSFSFNLGNTFNNLRPWAGTIYLAAVYDRALSQSQVQQNFDAGPDGSGAQAPSITQHPTSQTVTEGDTVTFSVTATGSSPLSYQWQKDGADITNATSLSYTIQTVVLADSGAYGCVVSNSGGNVTSSSATLTVNSSSSPPSITQHPTSQSVTEGQSATFSVTATGSGTLAYEWQKDGTNITNATSLNYVIQSVVLADSGDYSCIVSNGVGQDTSNVATLTVNASGPRVTSGLVVYYKFDEGSGTAVNDQSKNGTPMNLNLTGSYSWVSGGNGIIMSGGRASSDSGKVFDAVTVSNESSFEMWVTPDNLTQGGPARMMSIGDDSNTGYNYVFGQSSAEARVRLVLSGKTGSPPDTPRLKTSNSALNTGTPEIHLVHTYNGSGGEKLYVNGVLNPTAVGANGNFSNWVSGYQFNIGNEGDNSRPWNGTVYLAAVYDRALSQSEVQQNFDAGPNGSGVQALTVTGPGSQTIAEGDTVTFNVTPSGGSGALSFQWEAETSSGGGFSIISGAVDSSYTIFSVDTTYNGNRYLCIVSDTLTSVTSDTATLTVTPTSLPVITQHPTSQSVTEGQSVTFSVAATGSGNLAYQWQKDGAAISGAPDSSSYTLQSVVLADSGAYRCIVSNGVGQDTSNVATLAVYSTGVQNRTGTQWAPYLEWQLSNPNPSSGNKYDIIATATFVHQATSENRTTEMFYDGNNIWKFRFAGTKTGVWDLTTTCATDTALDGKSATVTINPNPDSTVAGFVTNFEEKWGRQGIDEAFVPQYVMYKAPDEYHNNATLIDADIQTYIVEHGFTGFHTTVYCRWFDLNRPDCASITNFDPDPQTFEALELLITKVHAAGGVVHLWAWGDNNKTPVPLPSGINGVEDQRIQRYIAARLGALSGWTMGYGYDLDEWVTEQELHDWHDYMQQQLGWSHVLGGRPAGPNGLNANPPDTSHANYVSWNQGLDYSSYEHWKPDYKVYVDALEAIPSQPVFSEDRFRIRNNGSAYKDYTEEETRRGLWHSTMAGGVANIWGNLLDANGNTVSTPQPYPNPEYIKTNSDFFKGRFVKELERDTTLSDVTVGVSMKHPANTHYIFYIEDASSIQMDLTTMAGPQPAIAVDTKQTYAEINLGTLTPADTTISLPMSDWAIAVGDFNNIPPVTSNTTWIATGSDIYTLDPVMIDLDGGSWTPDTSFALSAFGKIKTKEVVVDANWSDFVFDEGYELMSLEELQQKIQRFKHLPGIPSAQEVEANGIMAGEMQARFLQKIEELTLYIIQLKKRNQCIRQRILSVERTRYNNK